MANKHVYFCQCLGFSEKQFVCPFIISVSILSLLIQLNLPVQCCFFTDTFLEVITDAFVKSGLVLERDARQELRVSITL
jgi:hypothetical protein